MDTKWIIYKLNCDKIGYDVGRLLMKWKTTSSKYVLDTKFIKVRQDSVELPNGTMMDDYFIIEKKNVSLIVAMDENQNIILKEEYRYPIDKDLIELPGGTFELNETNPIEVAKRELKEETGYISEDWELLFTNYDYPTKDVNQVNVYLARNIKKVAGQELDFSENIEYKLVPLKEAVDMCMNKKICVNGTMAGILKVARMCGI